MKSLLKKWWFWLIVVIIIIIVAAAIDSSNDPKEIQPPVSQPTTTTNVNTPEANTASNTESNVDIDKLIKESTPTEPTEKSGHTFYTSSYRTSNFYYCDTDPGWKSLSPKYLHSFSSEKELLQNYSRVLHEPCK